jgi:hypothetical protein
MENFAKPSVLKNHRNSFNSSVKAIRELIDNMSSEYSHTADNISAYSDKRKGLIQSLENKFKKYNLDYKAPLIQNELKEIIGYAKELESQLDISLVSLDGDKKKSVLDDSLSIPSDITQIEVISDRIEKASIRLEELEKELSMIRIPEKDSKEEKVINFKNLVNKKKNTEKNESEIKEEGKVISFEDFNNDNISSEIFKEEDSYEEELSHYLDNLMGEETNVVKVNFDNNNSSLSDKVEAVYGDAELWDKIYKYNDNNKDVIDEKAQELGISPEEVVADKNALKGSIIDFPTELDLEEENVKRLG